MLDLDAKDYLAIAMVTLTVGIYTCSIFFFGSSVGKIQERNALKSALVGAVEKAYYDGYGDAQKRVK